jgi:hypothetical protein
VPSTEGTIRTSPAGHLEAGVARRLAEHRQAVARGPLRSSAGSSAAVSSPSSPAVKRSDRAMAATGTSAVVAPSSPTTCTGAASAGGHDLVEQPLGLLGLDGDRLDLDGQLDRRGRVAAAATAAVSASAAPLAVQGPAVDRIHDRGVVPSMAIVASTGATVDLRGERFDLLGEGGVVAVRTGSTARSVNRSEPGPRVERLVVRRVDGAVHVQGEAGRGGREGAGHVVGDDGAVGGHAGGQPLLQRRRGGRGRETAQFDAGDDGAARHVALRRDQVHP